MPAISLSNRPPDLQTEGESGPDPVESPWTWEVRGKSKRLTAAPVRWDGQFGGCAWQLAQVEAQPLGKHRHVLQPVIEVHFLAVPKAQAIADARGARSPLADLRDLL